MVVVRSGLWIIIYSLFTLSLAASSSVEYETSVNLWKYYYVIPNALLNSDDLNALGLSEYVDGGNVLDMASLGRGFTINALNDHRPILVPQNASLMFLFNTSSVMEPPKTKNNMLSEEFIHTSLPFGLPRYHYIVGSFLLVPKKTFKDRPLESADVCVERMGFDRNQIPLSKDLLNSPHQPIMTFILQCGQKLQDFSHEDDVSSTSDSYWLAKKRMSELLLTSNSEVAKAVIASSDEFFDNFARLWINALGYNALLNSLFCQVNTRFHEMSYCLKISGSGLFISLINKDPENTGETVLEKSKDLVKRGDGDEGEYEYEEEEGEEEDCDEEDEADSKFNHMKYFLHDWKYNAKKRAKSKLRHVLELLHSHISDCGENEEEDIDEEQVDCEDSTASEPDPVWAFTAKRNNEPSTNLTLMLDALTQKIINYEESNKEDLKPIVKRASIPSMALRAKTHISDAGRALHKKIDFSKIKLESDKPPTESLDDDDEKPEYIDIKELLQDPQAVAPTPYLNKNNDASKLMKRGIIREFFNEKFKNQHKDDDKAIAATNNGQEDCIEITWKKVFLYSLYGESPKFCKS